VPDSATQSEVVEKTARPAQRRLGLSAAQLVLLGIGLVFAVVAPLVLDTWLPAVMLLVAYAVGVVGFNILYAAGQLSLAHAAFMGIGGFLYAYLAGESLPRTVGLSLPPVIAALIALIAVGLVGLAFSPLTSRLGGLSLAAASMGMVFLADHLFGVASRVTGGAAGRPVPPMGIGSAEITSDEALWYFLVIVAGVSFVFAALMARSRVGRALYAIRDGELFAPAMGVEVRRFKAQAFFVSSIYAGLSGIMIGLIAGSLVSEAFTLTLSLNILMMAILGGVNYLVAGALAGSAIFVLLPEILRRYSSYIPFLAPEGSTSGITASAATSYIFGIAIIVTLIVRPDGLMSLVGAVPFGKKRDKDVPPAHAPGAPASGADH
jgi:branched-chain amino acid transport system permease protein